MAGSSRTLKIAGISFSIPVDNEDIQVYVGGYHHSEAIEYPDHTVPKTTYKNGRIKGLTVDLSGVKEQQFHNLLDQQNLSFTYSAPEGDYSGSGYIVLSGEAGKKQGTAQSDSFDLVCQNGGLVEK